MYGSDARSAQVIDDRIRPALESGSAVGSTKPVLLIIDEIDGATGGGGDNVRRPSSQPFVPR
jgi:chromosome transmission fidelity protein 18